MASTPHVTECIHGVRHISMEDGWRLGAVSDQGMQIADLRFSLFVSYPADNKGSHRGNTVSLLCAASLQYFKPREVESIYFKYPAHGNSPYY